MSSLVISGDTSGSVTLQAPAVSGTTTLTLPSVSGTVITTGSSGQVIPKAALPTGSVLQVSQATLAGTQAISGTSTWTDVTSLSVTITPTASTSKFLISFSINVQGENNTYFRFVRNGTAIGIGNADGSKSRVSAGNRYTGGTSWNGAETFQLSAQYLDSPATSSSITYKVQMYADSSGGTGSAYVNYSSHEVNNASSSRSMSTFTVMEISA